MYAGRWFRHRFAGAPRIRQSLKMLAPKVDADGNESPPSAEASIEPGVIVVWLPDVSDLLADAEKQGIIRLQ
jgi:hypothetical protein